MCDVDTGQCVVASDPVEAPTAVGFLIGNTSPSAHVWVDGRDTGRQTPIPRSDPLVLPAGTRELAFVVGDRMYRLEVVIEAGKTTKLIKKLE